MYLPLNFYEVDHGRLPDLSRDGTGARQSSLTRTLAQGRQMAVFLISYNLFLYYMEEKSYSPHSFSVEH